MAGFSPKDLRKTPQGAAPPIVVGDGCDLHFHTDLVGVRTEVSTGLRIGDFLNVVLLAEGQVRSAVCVTKEGNVVGTLAAFRGLARLIACMESGVIYSAYIETASSTRCAVQVQRR